MAAFAIPFIYAIKEGNEVDLDLVIIVAIVLFVCFVVFVVYVTLVSRRITGVLSDKRRRQRNIISSTSHELRTPLTLILADIDLLEREQGESEWIDDIREESHHMSRLVNKMVDLSRLDEGEWNLSPKNISVSELVQKCIMYFEPLAMRRSLVVKSEIPRGLYALIDEGEMKQVMFVLLDNAIKYCDEGGSIYVGLSRDVRNFEIVVENSFDRVGEIDLDRVFDRFYRGDTTREENKGYGVGLTLALMGVRKHGGSMDAYAKTDEGVIGFRIVMPV